MSLRFASRLVKLEAALAPSRDELQFTYEELHVFQYEVFLAFARQPTAPKLQLRLSELIARTESNIRSQAQDQATESYRKHVEGWTQEMWIASGHRERFVSPVLGNESQDWFLPNLSARRLATRCRPSIVALLGETTKPMSEAERPSVRWPLDGASKLWLSSASDSGKF